MKIYDTTSLPWEEWRDIPWYEWLYQVSNLWRVKSLERYVKNSSSWYRKILENVLTPFKCFWYNNVWLCSKWKVKKYRVHRLVASAFLWLDLNSFLDAKTSLCVCHKNDIRDDNRIDNLFLWTIQDNISDMHSKWRAAIIFWDKHHAFGKTWSNNSMSKKVAQYSLWWVLIRQYASATDASNFTWVYRTWIWKCCNNVFKQSWWYIWKYI